VSRVLWVLNSASGGATLSALDAMAALRQRGYRFWVALPPGGSRNALQAIREHTEAVEQLPLPWWNRNYKAAPWKRPLLWARDLWQSRFHLGTLHRLTQLIHRWQIDLVHTNTSLTRDPALAARLRGTPHLWHIREQIGRRQLFRFWLPERLTIGVLRSLSAAVVVNSLESRRLFDRHGCGEGVRVVYNGIDPEAFTRPAVATSALALRRSWGIAEHQVAVGMVAHLTSRMKRHHLFLRAAGELSHRPEIRFVMIGRDPLTGGGYRSEVAYARQTHHLADRLGLGEQLVWAGEIEDIPATMAALDVVVHPSDRESFGRVAVEAMAAGRPAIVAGSGGLAEIVADGLSGLQISSHDPRDYAKAIDRLVSSAELRREFGAAGQQRARKLFSIDQTAAQLDSIYRQVLAR